MRRRYADRRPPRLSLRVASPRCRRSRDALRRRRERRPGSPSARRADVVVSLAEDRAAASGPRARGRPDRVRAHGLAEDVRAAYDAPFPTPESKAGALAFPELVPTEPDHPNAAPMNRVKDALRGWRKPTLVVWGVEDAVLPVAIAHGFAELIPG